MKKSTRRTALKTSLGLGVVSSLPSTWVKPVVESVILPAHAQTSATTTPFPQPTFVPDTEPPVGENVTVSANGLQSASGRVSISDNDDPNPQIMLLTSGDHGTLTFSGANFSYSGTEIGYIGSDMATYKVSDASGNESPIYTIIILDLQIAF